LQEEALDALAACETPAKDQLSECCYQIGHSPSMRKEAA
jgi:hypothetical protein